jgi:hypothetical protein
MPTLVIGTDDGPHWDHIVGRMPHDVYHLHAFHALAERRGEGTGLLFALVEGPHVIAIPLVVRPLDDVPYLDGNSAGRLDVTSVHGYAGPICTSPQPPDDVRDRFLGGLEAELRERHVVTMFSRLNPLLAQRSLLHGVGEVVQHGSTVAVDLAPPDDERRQGYRRDTRRSLRRLADAGVEAHVDADLDRMDEFVELYEDTMDRVDAHPSHRLSADHLHDLAKIMRGRMFQVVCRLDGVAVAAGLYTMCNGIVQAHLGATRTISLPLAPAKLEIDAAITFAKAMGNRVFHLGGGLGAKADSLFAFKRGFGRTVLPFHGWHVVLDAPLYSELSRCADTSETPITYFPAYRASANHDALLTGGAR